MAPTTAPPTAAKATPARPPGASFCRSGSSALSAEVGTMATQDVDVTVVMPPPGWVLTNVVGTALDVVMWPMVIVLRTDIGIPPSSSSPSSLPPSVNC
jgi:hypothetical protein